MSSLVKELLTLLNDKKISKKSFKNVPDETINEIIDEIYYTEDNTNTYREFLIKRNPNFYLKYRTMIGEIPDLRQVGKDYDLKGMMKVDVWNPWKAVAEDFDALDTANNDNDIQIYELLDDYRENRMPADKYIENYLHSHTESTKNLIDFFITYPALGYLLGNLYKNIPFALIGENEFVAKNVSQSYRIDTLIKLNRYVKSRKILDITLKGVEVTEKIADIANVYENIALASWVVDHTADIKILKILVPIAIRADSFDLYKKLTKLGVKKSSKYIDEMIFYDSAKIFEYAVQKDKELSLDQIHKILHDCKYKILDVLTQRNQNARFDLWGDILHIFLFRRNSLDCIKVLVKNNIDLESPMQYDVDYDRNSSSIDVSTSPLLCALQHSEKEIKEYMLLIYESNSEDLLYAACDNALLSAVKYLLNKYEYSQKSLENARNVAINKITDDRDYAKVVKELSERLPKVDVEVKLLFKLKK